jgi:tetratricopeptide (TPR) repeat protein
LRYQGLYTNAAHNELLQTWAELGPVGAFLLLGMIFYAFRALRRIVLASKREEKNPPHFARLDGWIAWGGIGALTVLCAAGIMSFPLQLPVSTVLFFALLPLGEMLGEPERDEDGYRMPPLVMEGEWSTNTLYLCGMSRVAGVGSSLQLPRGMAWGVFVLGLALCSGWGWMALRPMRADVHYHKARQLEQSGDKTTAEKEMLIALAIYPNHHDCRSHYTSFLLEQKRYADCLPQLEKVFERLNTCELYTRRATVWNALGQPSKAAHDMRTYQKMVPMAGNN